MSTTFSHFVSDALIMEETKMSLALKASALSGDQIAVVGKCPIASPVVSSTLDATHLDAIEKLASDEKVPVERVKRLYIKALVSLSSDAKIENYVMLLTCKKVRENSLLPVVVTPKFANSPTNLSPRARNTAEPLH